MDSVTAVAAPVDSSMKLADTSAMASRSTPPAPSSGLPSAKDAAATVARLQNLQAVAVDRRPRPAADWAATLTAVRELERQLVEPANTVAAQRLELAVNERRRQARDDEAEAGRLLKQAVDGATRSTVAWDQLADQAEAVYERLPDGKARSDAARAILNAAVLAGGRKERCRYIAAVTDITQNELRLFRTVNGCT